MPRDESPREDLLAEATALVRRAELTGPEFPEPVVAGFWNDGGLSVYFGEDPVFRFDETGQLKRAFVEGIKYQVRDSTLVRLKQDRTSTDRVRLIRQRLTHVEARPFCQKIQELLTRLLVGLQEAQVTQGAAVPDDSDVVTELLDVLPVILAADSWLASRIDDER